MLTEERIAQRWKREEADGIIEVLGLKNPNAGDYPRSWDEPGLQSRTKDAIRSLFFAAPGKPEGSGPLKRGPVLLNGEKRELMLFPGGFLFSYADLTKFVRDEVREYFRGCGRRPKEAALDRFLHRYGLNPDGSITLEGFGSMMRDMRASHKRRTPKAPSNNRKFFSFWSRPAPKPRTDGLSWRSLDTRLRRALGRTDLPQKLDVAFRMADVEKIETVRGPRYEPHAFSDPVPTDLSLAVYIKAVEEPLMLTCEDPGQVEAWAEAFGACISSLALTSLGASSNSETEGLQQPNQGPVEKVQSSDCFENESSDASSASMGIVSELSVSDDDSYPELFFIQESDSSDFESISIDSTYILLAKD